MMWSDRTKAQAMVEFAMVLLLLIVLIVGVIEVGRVLFIFSSVITASREAVRYGSVAGNNDAGVPFYQDCDGIRNIVRKFEFLNRGNTVLIQYDSGPGTAVFDTCDNNVDTGVSVDSGDRILVTVTASYSPIIPIVPISARNIVFSSARTIVGIVQLDTP